MSWKLKRVKQCAKCPWRVDVDPYDIPNGYCETKHRDLKSTISEGVASIWHRVAMSCHEHGQSEEVHCIGWLVNQLGPGNNIGLRMMMRNCDNAGSIKTVGEQHSCFEDTLP